MKTPNGNGTLLLRGPKSRESLSHFGRVQELSMLEPNLILMVKKVETPKGEERVDNLHVLLHFYLLILQFLLSIYFY